MKNVKNKHAPLVEDEKRIIFVHEVYNILSTFLHVMSNAFVWPSLADYLHYPATSATSQRGDSYMKSEMSRTLSTLSAVIQ